ncbi:MAG: hypothetical protein AB7E51_10585 [Pseudodesulfovibrio sp.]|jgi:hypothetical protein|uniref:Uncharacterized protein n=1 Tax=Pseudodesulfovibrio indicus TaxID=1716143 RepID=A0A126QLC0_9BACT|nr:hypothetical protein [Pseudodesulfovibrio indicus]AMK10762.1 hypothetical protein AWY79_06375 [Pseudodesulfovibrio indicus]TDT91747.1 hypothetical protein EDC59_101146 [Pseudodesulfovibrio indicus]
MKRNTIIESFREILRQGHEARPRWRPDQAWRDRVMADVAALHGSAMAGELDRLAPRFTLAAAALSGVCLLASAWVLRDLSIQIMVSLSSQALHYGTFGPGI